MSIGSDTTKETKAEVLVGFLALSRLSNASAIVKIQLLWLSSYSKWSGPDTVKGTPAQLVHLFCLFFTAAPAYTELLYV